MPVESRNARRGPSSSVTEIFDSRVMRSSDTQVPFSSFQVMPGFFMGMRGKLWTETDRPGSPKADIDCFPVGVQSFGRADRAHDRGEGLQALFCQNLVLVALHECLHAHGGAVCDGP